MLRAVDSVWRTDTGRQRRDNEDSAYVRVPLFVVADGMGGAQAGEVASALAVEEFRRGLPDAEAGQATTEQRLAARVQTANRRIYETAQTERDQSGMGTTLTAVYLDGSDLVIAHVGDSRAYVLRNSELTRLTHDHSLVEELMRRGKLTPEQAAEHPQRSIITRALGIEPDVEVDTWSYPARAGDVVLLCSDGLTSMIDEGLVAQVLRSTPDLEQAGEQLIREANEAGGRDNITVILFAVADTDDTATGLDPATAPATTMMTAGPPLMAGSSERVPPRLARTQGRRPKAPAKRGEGLWFKVAAAVFSVAVVLFLFGGGGYLATRQLFFIGTNSDGIVTLYDGLPYDFLVPFWETDYTSGLPASTIPPADRKVLLNHDLRSQNSALALIRGAERGHYPTKR
jgi:serine/threonine protein phosphatase PrpC